MDIRITGMMKLSATLDAPSNEHCLIADSARAFLADGRGAAKAVAICGRSSESQRNMLAKQILRLPNG